MALRTLASRVATGVRCHYRQSLVTSTPSSSSTTARLLLPLLRRYSSEVKEEDCKFLKSHEYVFSEDKVGTVGISNFAQNALGDIVYVELPEVGSKLEKGKGFGVVESVKSASDVYSPVTGEVVGINDELKMKPDLVNADPYAKGWMLKVKIDNKKEFDELLSFAQYSEHIKKDSH
eukprot:TRINITY_DN25_c0_g1_i15.p2 TRINITY_DN25_c0_g1~~TRINITY_DN25_c0_g1_i15.p2  ORF type:complete len:176 (+),score=30.48 TRINITY_DN25_c0_g1_i15:1047-1574(+)